jgi:hypothetical protein
VRVAERLDRAKPTGAMSKVAGVDVPVIATPISQMTDRHDFPERPTPAKPLIIVK